MSAIDSVLLVAFGGPTRPSEIRPFLEIVARGRRIPPERLEEVLTRYREQGLFPAFPFGTDLTEEEVVLKKALLALKQTTQWKKLRLPRLAEISKTIVVPERARPYLERMALARAQTFKERLLQKALVYALASVDAI